jgi:hypothetical protein
MSYINNSTFNAAPTGDWDAVKNACKQLECMNYSVPELHHQYYTHKYEQAKMDIEKAQRLASALDKFRAGTGSNFSNDEYLNILQQRFWKFKEEYPLTAQEIVFNRVRAKYNWS